MAASKDKGSKDRFGYEWDKYSEIIKDYEEQFLKWVFPIQPKDFKGKRILDAGCGIGRNSYWPLKYGAKEVVSFDYDPRTVNVAKKNLSGFKNSKVSFNSIYDIAYKNEFDLAFSIGVIHHLEFPKLAVEKLTQATKKGGKVLIWVYGYESNEWIVRYINPIRKITSKLPVSISHAIAYLFSAPLYVYLKVFNPQHKYLQQIRNFKFWHVHSIVFDQLIPKIANYWKKDEALALFNKDSFEKIEAHRVNNNSWTIIGTKK